MKNIQVSFGEWCLSLNTQGLTLAHRRRSGQHLQVYFSPNPRWRVPGVWTPHITNPGKPRTWLPQVRFSDVLAAVKDFERDLLARYASCLRRVSLEQLVNEEWFAIVVPPDRAVEALEAHTKVGPGRYRFSEQALEELSSLGLEHIVPVEDVLLIPESRRCVAIVRVDASGNLERAHLHFLPGSPHDSDGPGWFLLPWDWLNDEAFDGILAAHVKPGFFKALRMIGDVLNLPVDHERIEKVESLAMRRWHRES